MADLIKNMEKCAVLVLKDEVSYQEGQVVSRTLAQSDAMTLTLFAFEKGEGISAHSSEGDAMVVCLDGTGKISIDDAEFILNPGETIVMPAGRPHAVFAPERFKMLLIVVF